MHEKQKDNTVSKNRSQKNTNDNRKGKGNYRRNKGKGKGPGSEAQGTSNDGIKSNDISWWNKSPIFDDVTRVPFNRISGSTLSISKICPGMGIELSPTGNDFSSVPGILRMDFVPTLGPAKDLTSPVNRCMTSLYAGNYARTTGAMQFSQADMALEILATDSIVANIGLVKRVLGLSNLYTGQNLYFPKTLINACGIDPDGVLGHQDEIRRTLNTHIQSLNSLKLPGYLDIWKRHFQLTTNVYADEDDVKAQFYTFVPAGYYMYTEEGAHPDISEVAFLQYIPFTYDVSAKSGIMSIESLLHVIDLQLQAIRHSSSFALISGSMQRAYPDSDLLTIGLAGLDDVCVPIPDRNMMWQVNNAMIVKDIDTASLHVIQDPVEDCLRCRPRSHISEVNSKSAGLTACRVNYLLNSYDGNTSPEFIMEATRLMCAGNVWPVDGDTSYIEYETFGTELLTLGRIYRYVSTTGGTPALDCLQFQTLLDASYESTLPGVISFVAELSRFRNHPRVEFKEDDKVSLPVGDLYRWTTVDQDTLQGLNEAALQSVYVVNVVPTIR